MIQQTLTLLNYHFSTFFVYICIPVKTRIIYLFTISLILFSCVDTTKVLQSANKYYKYKTAMDLYHNGKYFQAVPIIEDLITNYKGTDTAEMLYYTLADAYFKNKEYIVAAYHFKNYKDLYSASPRSELAMYNSAICYYHESPRFSLDQTETKNALENLQLFINEYPKSAKIDECNVYISKLRRKLETKALESAMLYYNMKKYKAAGAELRNVLKDFPDIAEAEELLYLATKSDYEYASKSIASKQPERFITSAQNTQTFLYKYPTSIYALPVKAIEEESYYQAINSAYQWGLNAFYEKRIEGFNTSISNHEEYISQLKTPRNIALADDILMQANKELIKTNYALAEESKTPAEKKEKYAATVAHYLKFVEKFPTKVNPELENIYQKASAQIANTI
jgi:outer membrane protein assembly factor BamD